MTYLALGALLAGLAAAFFLPVVALLVVMLASMAVGSVIFAFNGYSISQLTLMCLVWVILIQVGYGAGHVAYAVWTTRHREQGRGVIVSAIRAMMSSKKLH
jgi:hypothetical protein